MAAALDRTFNCAVELSLEMLGGKWKAVILAHLKQGPKTYGELRRLAPRMSDKMLTQRLADLTEHGLVEKVRVAREPRAVYKLSARGASLRRVLEAMHAWGTTMAPEVGARIQLASTSDERGVAPSASRDRRRSTRARRPA